MKLGPALPTLALGLALVACRAAGTDPYGTLTMEEVEKSLGQPGVAVFDANLPELWEEHHLPGAVHIVGKNLAKVLPGDRGAKLIFYCTNPK